MQGHKTTVCAGMLKYDRDVRHLKAAVWLLEQNYWTNIDRLHFEVHNLTPYFDSRIKVSSGGLILNLPY